MNYSKAAHNFEDWHRLENIDAEVIFVGNSRTWVHFDPMHFEKVTGLSSYCLAEDGYGIPLLYGKVVKYLESNNPPRYLILQVDPSMVRRRENIYNKDTFLKYIFLDRESINSYLSGYNGFSRLEVFTPLLRYKGYFDVFLKHLLGIEKYNRVRGFNNTKEVWGGEELREDRTWDYDSREYGYIDRIRKLCESKGIILKSHFPPLTKELYESIAGKDDIESYLARIGVEYIDWNKLMDRNTFSKRYFHNHLHLNSHGVQKMNDLIDKHIGLIIEHAVAKS